MRSTAYRLRRVLYLLLAAGLPTATACQPTPAGPPAASKAPAGAAAGVAAFDREVWEVFYIQGNRVGYGMTTVRKQSSDGAPILRIESLNHLAIRRGGNVTSQDIRFQSRETAGGRLLDFESELRMATSPMRTVGRVAGNQLVMETTTEGKSTTSTIPWSDEYRGLYAMELSLLEKPMTPGERRSMRTLVAGFNQVAELQLVARQVEAVELPAGRRELLRIDTAMKLSAGPPLAGAIWVDDRGEVLKTHVEMMGLDSYRTTKDAALAAKEQAVFDLTPDLNIAVARPAGDVHRAQRVRYRLTLDNADPAKVFPASASQQVRPIDAHSAEVVALALRPGGGSPAADAPTDDDRQPNNILQSDAAEIVAMAKQVAPDERDPWKIVVALEQHVRQWITQKDFSQAFATAAEVARQRKGDCTEHAVLLAALARARGIPARVAIGLVYVQSLGTYGYHMWNEVFVDNRWIPVDATLAMGGIGGGHLKLADGNLKGASAYSSFLPVVQVIGHLKIEVLSVE